VNNDTENIHGPFLRVNVFPTKPLSSQIFIITNEESNIINCVTKNGTTPSWNKRNFEGKEASQFKADVEALQASNIFVLASK